MIFCLNSGTNRTSFSFISWLVLGWCRIIFPQTEALASFPVPTTKVLLSFVLLNKYFSGWLRVLLLRYLLAIFLLDERQPTACSTLSCYHNHIFSFTLVLLFFSFPSCFFLALSLPYSLRCTAYQFPDRGTGFSLNLLCM